MHREGRGVTESPRGLGRRDGKVEDSSGSLLRGRGAAGWRIA